jgi:hypothetical protein
MTALRAGAITIAFVSGTLALVALAVGSPLQFGAALALCGAGWIATDFIEYTAVPAGRRCAVPAERLNSGYEICRVVHIGARERFSAPTPSARTRLAA